MLPRLLAVAAAAWTIAAPAEAAWRRAETERFVIYGEGSEAKVREYAEKLTTFDATLRAFYPAANRPSYTKTQVVMVGERSDLRRIRPDLPREVAGFYAASNEGIFAIALADGSLGADDTLFHEYAHHFLLENFPVAYPAWFVEGFAEYFMTAEIDREGVKVGGYNPARAVSIFTDTWMPWDEVFRKRTFEIPRRQRFAFYAQAWLLTHYMHNGDRNEKLDKAIRDTAGGMEPAKAFWTATGLDQQTLTRELRAYRKLNRLLVPRSKLPTPKVTVTRMPDSADDLFFDHVRLLLSETGKTDPAFLAQVRARAARHPDDVFAQSTLARAEFVMGDVAAGEALVRRLRAAHPDDYEVMLLEPTGQWLAGLREPAMREARWRAARPLFAKVHAVNKTDFRPLYGYAVTRTLEPTFPTDNDIGVLLEARALAPPVQESSFRAGVALLKKGRREEAEKVLGPVINNPHGGAQAVRARALLEGRTEDEVAKEEETAS
ncbi:hypothetical protein [Phenylobacterium sp.]|uniref:hypothetical protein n=1 Tax=Phenylobacterium sp. TaxID=1871053 RepID=UPI0035B46B2F